MKFQYYYLVHIQYLGFRFSGWYKQPDVKTVQQMIERTIIFVIKHNDFKTIGCSRTDAMVSANHSVFELFINESLPNDFLGKLNYYLPNDINVLKVEETNGDFNIIQSPKSKEYHYLFAFGQNSHPFAAPILNTIPDDLNIELMKSAAKLFEGEHNFQNYCTKPSENTQFLRTIDKSEISENDIYTANFFPTTSYIYKIEGKGFLRYQIRLMMGQLILLGKGEITLEYFKHILLEKLPKPLPYIASASGLILNKVKFN